MDYELRDDMLGFHSFLRMGSTEFNEILEAIAEDIMRMDTVMRDSVTPKERLVVTLRYLASGKPCNVQMFVIMTINVYGKYCDVRNSCQECMHKKIQKITQIARSAGKLLNAPVEFWRHEICGASRVFGTIVGPTTVGPIGRADDRIV